MSNGRNEAKSHAMIDDHFQPRETVENEILPLAEARNANRDRTFKSPRHSPLNGSNLNLAANFKVFLLERRLPASRAKASTAYF